MPLSCRSALVNKQLFEKKQKLYKCGKLLEKSHFLNALYGILIMQHNKTSNPKRVIKIFREYKGQEEESCKHK